MAKHVDPKTEALEELSAYRATRSPEFRARVVIKATLAGLSQRRIAAVSGVDPKTQRDILAAHRAVQAASNTQPATCQAVAS